MNRNKWEEAADADACNQLQDAPLQDSIAQGLSSHACYITVTTEQPSMSFQVCMFSMMDFIAINAVVNFFCYFSLRFFVPCIDHNLLSVQR